LAHTCSPQDVAQLLNELTGNLFDVQARGDQVLSKRKPVGARTFDAHPSGADSTRQPHDLGKPPAVVGGADRVDLTSEFVDDAAGQRALVRVDTDDASHHHLPRVNAA
jgi:hypothetical protein